MIFYIIGVVVGVYGLVALLNGAILWGLICIVIGLGVAGAGGRRVP